MAPLESGQNGSETSSVAPIDELRILYRYAGSLHVHELYARMEELAGQLGYGHNYGVALREADAKTGIESRDV